MNVLINRTRWISAWVLALLLVTHWAEAAEMLDKQTLKALANLLQNYRQKFVSRTDYAQLLRVFAFSHRGKARSGLTELEVWPN